MNIRGTMLWGFVSTIVLTGIMSGSQERGLTRMSLPYMLGTMVSPDRERAKLVGFLMHMLNGWLFAALYYLLPNLSNYSYITPAAHGELPNAANVLMALAYAGVYIAIIMASGTLILGKRNFK